MQTKLACFALAALIVASCDKTGEKANPADASSTKSQAETRADTPKIAENPAPARSDSPDGNVGHPPDSTVPPPAGTAPTNDASAPLTAEQTIAKYKSSGIPGIPQYVSEKIVSSATKAESPEAQLDIITQQTTAWRHINTFRESDGPIPEHMRMMLLERLARKHGDSWIEMVSELDEQIAANVKVDKLRANGIPGLSPDESQNLIIDAIGKYGPDYKAILSVAEQSAKK